MPNLDRIPRLPHTPERGGPPRARRDGLGLVPALAIRRVDLTSDEGWRLLPILCRRVAAFCVHHPTDLSGPDLVAGIRQDFVAGQAGLGLWALVQGDAVVGHLLARYDPYRKVAFVVQVEVETRLSVGLAKRALRLLDTWARGQGATAIDAVTWHDVRRRWAGFRLHRLVLRRPL